MDDRELDAIIKLQDVLLEELRATLEACSDAELTLDDILRTVRPVFLGEEGILIDGPLIEPLRDGEASTVMRILYGALSEGATLSFIAARRTPTEVYLLCDDAGIGRANVTIIAEAHWLRVSIARLQS